MVGSFTFKHEIDGENNAGDDIEELSGPVAYGEKQISGEIRGKILQFGVEHAHVDTLHKRDMSNARQQLRSARRQFVEKLAQVTHHWRQREDEKQRSKAPDCERQN